MNELTELRNAIDRNDQAYFLGGSRPVDDSVYDGYKRRLKELAPDDERLTRVGAPVTGENTGKKARHVHPMGSLDNVMNEEEFMVWHEKIVKEVKSRGSDGRPIDPDEGPGEEDGPWAEGWEERSGLPLVSYNVSFKMDGCSVALIYKDGYLTQAITRGDGQVGEDITANALRMQGVPRYVEFPDTGACILAEADMHSEDDCTTHAHEAAPFTGSVRGEVMLYNEDWKKLDPDQLSNPRNLGNGMARRKDGEDTELLRFVAFRGFDAEGKPMGDTESGNLNSLMNLGFSPVPFSAQCSASEVLAIYEAMQGGAWPMDTMPETWVPRDALPFEIDGLVVKVEDLALQAALGEASNRPRAQVAFKFPPRGATALLRDVEWTVGHTGAIIPTAVLDPVKIGGVTVSRALLCNMEEIERLKVGIGSLVSVVRAGDVIPKITGSTSAGHVEPIEAPEKCPACEGEVGYRKGVDGDDSVHLYCLNEGCSAKQLGKIKTWVKKLDIQGLGDVYLDALFKPVGMTDAVLGLYPYRAVSTIADIYNLRGLHGTAALVEVVGVARAKKILSEIDKKRELSLSDFLGSLGIDGLGRRRVKLVQEAAPGEFDTLADWQSGKLRQWAKQVGLPKMADVIQERIDANAALIEDLQKAGVRVVETPTAAPEPKGDNVKTYVLTGTFSVKKEILHSEIVNAGHRFTETYNKTVDAVVASDPASGSSKLKKAAKDGVRVISVEELMEELK